MEGRLARLTHCGLTEATEPLAVSVAEISSLPTPHIREKAGVYFGVPPESSWPKARRHNVTSMAGVEGLVQDAGEVSDVDRLGDQTVFLAGGGIFVAEPAHHERREVRSQDVDLLNQLGPR